MLLCFPRVEDLIAKHDLPLRTLLLVCAYLPTALLMIFSSIHIFMRFLLVLATGYTKLHQGAVDSS
jgi:hypothetical protein